MALQSHCPGVVMVTRVKEWLRYDWSLAVALIVVPMGFYHSLPTSIGGTESSVSFYWLYLNWRLRPWPLWFGLLWLTSFFLLLVWSASRRMRFRIGVAVSFALVQLLAACYVNQHCRYMFPQNYPYLCHDNRLLVYMWMCATCLASLLFLMSMLLVRWRIPVVSIVRILTAISLSVLPVNCALFSGMLPLALVVSVVALLLALGLMLCVRLHVRVNRIAPVLVLLAVFVATLVLPRIDFDATMSPYRGHASSAWWPDGHVYHLAFEDCFEECFLPAGYYRHGSYLLYRCDPTGLVCELVARVTSKRWGWSCFSWIPSSPMTCLNNEPTHPWQDTTLQVTPDGKALHVVEGNDRLYTLYLNQ